MNRYLTLSGEPLGSWPEADTFVLREGPTPEPGPGQALTRTLYISLDADARLGPGVRRFDLKRGRP